MKKESDGKRAGNKRLLYWAAGLSIAALVAHAIDVPDHLNEWWGYSAFFVTLGAFQFFYGFLLLLQPWKYDETGGVRSHPERFGRPYYLLGGILTVPLILVYVVSRTTGIPFLGPDAAAESVTLLSLVPLAQNAALMYCLVKLWNRSGARSQKESH